MSTLKPVVLLSLLEVVPNARRWFRLIRSILLFYVSLLIWHGPVTPTSAPRRRLFATWIQFVYVFKAYVIESPPLCPRAVSVCSRTTWLPIARSLPPTLTRLSSSWPACRQVKPMMTSPPFSQPLMLWESNVRILQTLWMVWLRLLSNGPLVHQPPILIRSQSYRPIFRPSKISS